MPARLKLVGPTSRHGVFLYDEDVLTVDMVYHDHGLSGFVRELVHRHCELVRQKQQAGAAHAQGKTAHGAFGHG